MIVITFKDENGKEIEQKLIIDAEMIQRNKTLKEYFWEIWLDRYNECICTLHEGQSYCECEGIYGKNTEISKIEDKNEESTVHAT